MTTPRHHVVPDPLLIEIHAAALTLRETADHLIRLTRHVNPDYSNTKFLVGQAYEKVLALARRFDIDI